MTIVKPAIPAPPREASLPAMRCIDTTDNPRIPVLMEMVGALSRANDPKEVLKAYAEGVRKLQGPAGYISLSTRGLRPSEYRITRLLTDESQANELHNADPWSRIATMPVHRGGLLGEIIQTAYPTLIHGLHLPHDPVLNDALAKFRSLMAVPLYDNGEPLNWAIMLHSDPEFFSVDDLEQSILRGNMVGTMVKTTLLAKQLQQANDRIRGEIEQIARIQRALLPQRLPDVPGLTIATSYETFDTAGGDLYDFRLLESRPERPTQFDGCVEMLVADAAGHGPAAAVITAMLNSLLYAYPCDGRGPGHVFEFANRHLCAKQIDGTFVTAFLARYNPRDHTLTYARAGHNPPLIKTIGEGGPVTRLDAVGGVPLGVLEEATFEDGVAKLMPGQTLVMYTDGVTEAMNPAGEPFGVQGIERALEACSGEPACVVDSITTALRAHEAGVRPRDDQTIVAVKVE